MPEFQVIESGAKKAKKIFIVLVICFFLIIIGCDSFKIVPAGNVAVVTRFGKIQSHYMSPGLNYKLPFIDRTHTMTTRLQEYTMSVSSREGKKYGNDAITALTKEGLMVALDLTAWYKLLPSEASKVYNEIGVYYVSKVVRPLLRTVIRNVVVKYSAEDLYSSKREAVSAAINEKAQILIKNKGIVIERVLLRNVSLPKNLSKAISEKQEAEQHAKKMEFVLQKEEMEAKRKVVEAKGIKGANKIIAEGLTPNYLRWYRIEMLKKLVNSPNNTILIIPEDLKSVPMILPTK